MDEMLRKNDGKEKLECDNCYAGINIGEEFAKLEDGTIRCRRCFDHLFPICEFCGKRMAEDEVDYWGDCICCPECYEGFYPTFSQEENEVETNEAYQAMMKRYIGKKSNRYSSTSVELEETYYDVGQVTYKMEVWLDEEGKISDISRLTAEMLISETVNSSRWGSFIIRNEDYEDKVYDLMDKLELEE